MVKKVCKVCQKVHDEMNMAKNRAICKKCFRNEYVCRYNNLKTKIKEKRNEKRGELIMKIESLANENNMLKEELNRTKMLLEDR